MKQLQSNNPLVPTQEYNGFFVGAISTLAISAIKNRYAVKNREATPKEALKSTIKETFLGGVALSTAAGATDKLLRGQGGVALLEIALGASIIYMIESIDNNKKESQCKAKTVTTE